MEKGFTTIEEQIQILKERGLIINNEDISKNALQRFGYYNLINGYKQPFVSTNNSDIFLEDVYFEYILALREFDSSLRNELLHALLKIEELLKSVISYEFAKEFGGTAYTSISSFDEKNNKVIDLIEKLEDSINLALKKCDDNSYECVRHYNNKYKSIPIWVLFRITYISQLSRFYECMQKQTKKEVCAHLTKIIGSEITHQDLYVFFRIMVNLRNLCAHGQRIYNFSTKFNIPQNNVVLEKLRRYNMVSYNMHSLDCILVIFKQLLIPLEYAKTIEKIIKAINELIKKTPEKLHSTIQKCTRFNMTLFSTETVDALEEKTG